LPIIARIAAVVAFLMAAGTILSAVTGQIFALPFAFIPLAAGVGILFRRAWSAWGFALYTLAQLIPLALVLFRTRNDATRPPGAAGAVILAAILAPLFLLAGRSLAASGARKGRAWPWIAISALTTVPLIFFQISEIPNGSMENTLLAGDRILVLRFPNTAPARGDLIVFHYPIDRRQTFVQRVIGVGGDRIRIAGGMVYRNGAALQEPYAIHKPGSADAYRDNFPGRPGVVLYDAEEEMLTKDVVNGEVVVPEGKYFVLGDNRDVALDSRYWGFVDSGDVIGKPLLIYGSEEETEGPAGARAHRVRWGRLLRIL
jgi:signal peptidase I